jgi:ubiquinone/menaquinone biosynthesis C-methylase UbiE
MPEPNPPRDGYRWIAKGYDAVVDPFNRAIWQIVVTMRPAGPGDQVLDVGCGTGTALVAYQRAGYVASGIDLSAAMLARARARLSDSADLRIGDATDLPYEDDSFDLVTAAFVIHELPAPVRADVLAEMVRVTRSGGRTMVIDHGAPPFRGLKGMLGGASSTLFEFIAGREHFRNFRRYRETGGVPGVAEHAGLAVAEEKILSGGTIGIYVLARPGG